jgi:hypothetical protein
MARGLAAGRLQNRPASQHVPFNPELSHALFRSATARAVRKTGTQWARSGGHCLFSVCPPPRPCRHPAPGQPRRATEFPMKITSQRRGGRQRRSHTHNGGQGAAHRVAPPRLPAAPCRRAVSGASSSSQSAGSPRCTGRCRTSACPARPCTAGTGCWCTPRSPGTRCCRAWSRCRTGSCSSGRSRRARRSRCRSCSR